MRLILAALIAAGLSAGLSTWAIAEGPDLIFRTRTPDKLQSLLAEAPGRVIEIDPQTVYYRPPASYLDPPSTLLAVLRKLLVRPLREGARETEAASV